MIGKDGRFQFHLSTAIIVMFVASGLLFVNMQPVLHFDGVREAKEWYSIKGYGWPFIAYDGHRIDGLYLLLDAGLALEVLLVSTCGLELGLHKNVAVRRGVACGLAAGAASYALLYQIGSVPAATPVSLAILYKPPAQNWRTALVVFFVVTAFIGILSAIRSQAVAPIQNPKSKIQNLKSKI